MTINELAFWFNFPFSYAFMIIDYLFGFYGVWPVVWQFVCTIYSVHQSNSHLMNGQFFLPCCQWTHILSPQFASVAERQGKSRFSCFIEWRCFGWKKFNLPHRYSNWIYRNYFDKFPFSCYRFVCWFFSFHNELVLAKWFYLNFEFLLRAWKADLCKQKPFIQNIYANWFTDFD